MPYFVTDKSEKCPAWATVKEDGEVMGCHATKADAIAQMVAISIAEHMPPAGERAVGDPVGIIVDIDDTLIHLGGEPDSDVIEFVNNFDGRKFIVTGRQVSERAKTVKELSDAGVKYTALFMKDADEPTSTFKKKIAERLLDRYDIVLAIDNDANNRAAFSSLGIKTMNPATIDSADMQDENRALNISAPQFMQENAKRGLKYYAEGKGGDGLVPRTIREARLMANGQVSDDKWIRIAAWIARHMPDLDSPNADPNSDNYPSAGVVAHLLWGSSGNKNEARRAMEFAQNVVEKIRAEEKRAKDTEMIAKRDSGDWEMLNDRQKSQAEEIAGVALEYGQFDQSSLGNGAHYAPADKNPFKEDGLVCDNCIFYNEMNNQCQIVSGTIEPEAICKLWIIPEMKIGKPIEETPATENNRNTHFRSVGLLTGVDKEQQMTNKVERRINHVDFEIRDVAQSSDKMTFRGYAAVFNSPSQPLPFTEYIANGAFTRSLKSRNEVKLFRNHNTDIVLGSTRAGTLRLTEDSTGLLAEADLPPTTDGKDLSILIQRGDVNSMSFGFSVPQNGDSWSTDGSTRTLNQIRLHEVSIVTGFPAYEATTASVRSLEILATRTSVDVDALSDAITKLEAGETLDGSDADLISEVVNKLRAEPKSDEANWLEIKRKHLDLMGKIL